MVVDYFIYTFFRKRNAKWRLYLEILNFFGTHFFNRLDFYGLMNTFSSSI